MKICITDNSTKSCGRAMGDCIGCVPGGGIHVFEHLSTSELVELAARCSSYVEELSCVTDELVILYHQSKLGRSNKRVLLDQLIRLARLDSNMVLSGSTLLSNLMIKRDIENVSRASS